MDIKEHIYYDDPNFGPADVRTNLKDVDYYFLGNGYIEVAIQISPSGTGTPAGVLIMDTEKFGPKRKSLTMDLDNGLKDTTLMIQTDIEPAAMAPASLQHAWTTIAGIPAVQLKWKAASIDVAELFYCPDRETPRLIREIHLVNTGLKLQNVTCRTGIKGQFVDKQIKIDAARNARLAIEYQIDSNDGSIKFQFLPDAKVKLAANAKRYWKQTVTADFGSPVLNHLFTVSKNLISANTSHSGRMDASI
jgi:hypothetical protein